MKYRKHFIRPPPFLHSFPFSSPRFRLTECKGKARMDISRQKQKQKKLSIFFHSKRRKKGNYKKWTSLFFDTLQVPITEIYIEIECAYYVSRHRMGDEIEIQLLFLSNPSCPLVDNHVKCDCIVIYFKINYGQVIKINDNS